MLNGRSARCGDGQIGEDMLTTIASCLLMASQAYSVPPQVMFGIYKVEGGQVGQAVRNTNGSYDLGPMQINTIWIPELARLWGVNERTARKWVQTDACVNAGVSAWILRKHMDETRNLSRAISYYHSRTPHLGRRYHNKVLRAMYKNGWLKLN